jgi:hypothetical protein
MRSVEHQEPIETFGANSSDESLRDAVGLRRAERRTNDLDPIATEHVIETASECLIPVPNQEPDRFRARRRRSSPGECRRSLIRSIAKAPRTGAPEMVGLFDAIGIGQWFRYVTGSIEVVSAVALLVPSWAAFGALLLIPTMVGAVFTQVNDKAYRF